MWAAITGLARLLYVMWTDLAKSLRGAKHEKNKQERVDRYRKRLDDIRLRNKQPEAPSPDE